MSGRKPSIFVRLGELELENVMAAGQQVCIKLVREIRDVNKGRTIGRVRVPGIRDPQAGCNRAHKTHETKTFVIVKMIAITSF